MRNFLFILSTVICLAVICASYDLTFNTDRDWSQWKFNGSYLYGQKVQSLGIVLPESAINAVTQEEVPRTGFWLIRYNGPDADNFLRLEYRLHHHLFNQALVTFVASPNVPVTLLGNNQVQIGKFWSDGKKWCDAIVSVHLMKEIYIDVSTPSSGDYVLIDKVVLGVMSNIAQTAGRDINPCRTSPSTEEIREEDMAPDMEYKPIPSRTQFQNPPLPDMAVKPTSSWMSRNSPHPPPDMSQKRDPQLDTNTITTGDATGEASSTNDSSEVKCGCSCSCSRVKNKRNNSTMPSSVSG